MLERLTSAIAANRFGLGSRPGELDAIGGNGRDWLRAQLKDAPPRLTDAGLQTSSDILVETLDLRREIRASRQNDASVDAAGAQAAAAVLMKVPQLLRPIYIEEATARFKEAVNTDRPFVERLTQFWTNHFAVSVDKNVVLGLAGSLEREAIHTPNKVSAPPNEICSVSDSPRNCIPA